MNYVRIRIGIIIMYTALIITNALYSYSIGNIQVAIIWIICLCALFTDTYGALIKK